jgi:prepilin-type N-terminal cleavage/methylation domain-containing protein
MFKSKNHRSGFTLLEILLVVGIIAILAGIVIVAINPSRQLAAARDTERRSDLKQINNALLQYYIDNQSFPESVASETLTEICNSGSGDGTGCVDGTINLSALVPKYLSAIPTDPKGSTDTTTGYRIALSGSRKLYLKAPSTEISQTYIAIGSGEGVIDTNLVGIGTSENPFRIYSWTDLDKIRYGLSAHYILMNNLLSSDEDYTGIGDNWVPIGDYSEKGVGEYGLNPFGGSLDGGNNTIANLKINISGSNPIGLFGYVDRTGIVSNLGLVDVDVDGSLTGISAGGLVGDLRGQVLNSYTTGNLVGPNGAGTSAGGLVGASEGTISHSYSTVDVVGYINVGGLVGVSYGPIQNSYATGKVSGVGGNYNGVGGLIGTTYSTRAIVNSYSVGQVSGSVSVGGLIGYKGSGVSATPVSNSYWNIQTSTRENSVGGEGKTISEMKLQETFIDWDFGDIWAISGSVNSGYPYLR